ncbi:hypothetical protein [Clostridium sp. 19966]|uniref:hypothetical protein n=1 Tax=Clostridium sp. 19966 TaxID=2768166 RepID=UPI0028E862B2|nr:hypothetical protein [Clostridium sp. 19966]
MLSSITKEKEIINTLRRSILAMAVMVIGVPMAPAMANTVISYPAADIDILTDLAILSTTPTITNSDMLVTKQISANM